MPSDVTDVELVIEGVDKEQALPALVAIAQDQSDNSVTSLYDADFSGMSSEPCVVAVSGCLGFLVVSMAHAASRCVANLTSGCVTVSESISCAHQG